MKQAIAWDLQIPLEEKHDQGKRRPGRDAAGPGKRRAALLSVNPLAGGHAVAGPLCGALGLTDALCIAADAKATVAILTATLLDFPSRRTCSGDRTRIEHSRKRQH